MTETHPSPKASGEGSSIYPLFAKSGVSNFLQKSSISPWDVDIWEPQSVQPNTYVFIKFSRYAHFTFWQLCQSAHQKLCTDLYCLFLTPYIEYLSLSTCFEGNPISQRLVYLIYPSKVLVLDLIHQFHRLFALWLMEARFFINFFHHFLFCCSFSSLVWILHPIILNLPTF